MDRDTREAYRFGPMPSWFAHRQIAHDHGGLEPDVEPAKATRNLQREGATPSTPIVTE